MSTFRFKAFSIRQDQTPMKVGTDGVLLGAWVALNGTERRILDVGTGTGLIALMLAQRAPYASIVGVDVVDVGEARENADASPWAERLHFVQQAVQTFAAEPFDLIVSNPPFFVESLLCPDAGRTQARHTVELPFDALRDAVVRLLAEQGRFAVVLPTVEAERFIALCEGVLQVVRRTEVRTTPRHAPKRVLLEFQRADAVGVEPCRHAELMIGTGEHETYTEEYRRLTGDFYLKF